MIAGLILICALQGPCTARTAHMTMDGPRHYASLSECRRDMMAWGRAFEGRGERVVVMCERR